MHIDKVTTKFATYALTRLGHNNPYISTLKAWLQLSNKEPMYRLVLPPPIINMCGKTT